MNKIFHRIHEERKGHYCHALEVNDVYGLEGIIESFIQEYKDEFTYLEYIEFFESMELYYLPYDNDEKNQNDDDEKAVYDFSFEEYIKGTI